MKFTGTTVAILRAVLAVLAIAMAPLAASVLVRLELGRRCRGIAVCDP